MFVAAVAVFVVAVAMLTMWVFVMVAQVNMTRTMPVRVAMIHTTKSAHKLR